MSIIHFTDTLQKVHQWHA